MKLDVRMTFYNWCWQRCQETILPCYTSLHPWSDVESFIVLIKHVELSGLPGQELKKQTCSQFSQKKLRREDKKMHRCNFIFDSPNSGGNPLALWLKYYHGYGYRDGDFGDGDLDVVNSGGDYVISGGDRGDGVCGPRVCMGEAFCCLLQLSECGSLQLQERRFVTSRTLIKFLFFARENAKCNTTNRSHPHSVWIVGWVNMNE